MNKVWCFSPVCARSQDQRACIDISGRHTKVTVPEQEFFEGRFPMKTCKNGERSLVLCWLYFIIFASVLSQQLIQKGGGTVPDDALATLVPVFSGSGGNQSVNSICKLTATAYCDCQLIKKVPIPAHFTVKQISQKNHNDETTIPSGLPQGISFFLSISTPLDLTIDSARSGKGHRKKQRHAGKSKNLWQTFVRN